MTYRIPFGYRIVHGMITEDSEKADAVRSIFYGFLEGIPIVQLGRDLETKGFENAKGNVKWLPRSIRDILSNAVYAGTEEYPQIVPPEIVERVHRKRKEQAETKGDSTIRYWYSGKLVCGSCGSEFYRKNNEHMLPSGKITGKSYWRCKKRLNHEGYYRELQITDKELETICLKIINQLLSNPDLYRPQSQIRQLIENDRTQALEQKIQSIVRNGDIPREQLASLYLKLAAEQFLAFQFHDEMHQTEQMEACLQSLTPPITKEDDAVFGSVIKKLVVQEGGIIEAELTNGVELPGMSLQ